MSDYLALADEIEKLPTNTALRLTPRAQHTIVAALRMVKAVDEMMATLGAMGEISPKSPEARDVMEFLDKVDPK